MATKNIYLSPLLTDNPKRPFHCAPYYLIINKKCNTMEKPSLVKTIACYQPLLERYAMRLTKDKAVAEKLTKVVLNNLYEEDTLLPSACLRKILQRDLRHRCFYWMQSKIFDRPVLKVPYKQEIQPPLLMNNNETTR